MDGSKIMKELNGMEVYDEASREMIAGVSAHSDDGVTYTATVKGIDELITGVNFLMIPDKDATDVPITLEVNGLAAVPIRQRLSSSSKTVIIDQVQNWIMNGKPVRVTYCVDDVGLQYWYVDAVVPNAKGLYGTVPVTSGGTGADTVADARENLGLGGVEEDGTGALSVECGGTGCTSLADFKTAIGFIDEDNGIVPISMGGTGCTNTTRFKEVFFNTPLTPEYGGTGLSGDEVGSIPNAIITWNNIDSMKTVNTASGAFYATKSNGAAQFGTLPIAQGGTGATTASDALNALGITWGTTEAPSEGTPNTIYIQIN